VGWIVGGQPPLEAVDRFLLARGLDVGSGMATAFYTVYALRDLGANEASVGLFTLMMMSSQTVGMLGFGWLADRRGHLVVLALGAACAGGAATVALAAVSLGALYVTFALLGLGMGATHVSGMAIALEFRPEDERPTYIAINNSSRAPFLLVAPLIGGLLADRAGYAAVFAVAAALAFAAALTLTFAVVDPRRRA